MREKQQKTAYLLTLLVLDGLEAADDDGYERHEQEARVGEKEALGRGLELGHTVRAIGAVERRRGACGQRSRGVARACCEDLMDLVVEDLHDFVVKRRLAHRVYFFFYLSTRSTQKKTFST